MELAPGRRYRFWIRGKPLPDTVKFEKVILQQQHPDQPRLVEATGYDCNNNPTGSAALSCSRSKKLPLVDTIHQGHLE